MAYTKKNYYEDNFVMNHYNRISEDFTFRSGVLTAATTTLTIVTATPAQLRDMQFTLQSADETSRTYYFHDNLHDSYATGANDFDGSGCSSCSGKILIDIKGLSSVATIATEVKTAIEHANGHSGKLTASVASGVITISQVTEGYTGNTTIDLAPAGTAWNSSYATMQGGIADTAFSGGDKRFVPFSYATKGVRIRRNPDGYKTNLG